MQTNNYDIYVGARAATPRRENRVVAILRAGAPISPDGKYVAYVSDESGRDEVYVRPFRMLVRAAGLFLQRWHRAALGAHGRSCSLSGPIYMNSVGVTSARPSSPRCRGNSGVGTFLRRRRIAPTASRRMIEGS